MKMRTVRSRLLKRKGLFQCMVVILGISISILMSWGCFGDDSTSDGGVADGHENQQNHLSPLFRDVVDNAVVYYVLSNASSSGWMKSDPPALDQDYLERISSSVGKILCHFEYSDIVSTMDRSHTSIKPGGHFIATVKSGDTTYTVRFDEGSFGIEDGIVVYMEGTVMNFDGIGYIRTGKNWVVI